jgi:hypothetical protein
MSSEFKKCGEKTCNTKMPKGLNKYHSYQCRDKAKRRRDRLKKKDSPNAWKKKAWTEFSKWIRARDKKCVTCGSTENLQAGHFIKASQCYNYFNFDEQNVHAQCTKCNVFLDGNYIEYTLFMQREYGLEVVDELKQRNLAHSTIKATKEGYQALLEKYSNL